MGPLGSVLYGRPRKIAFLTAEDAEDGQDRTMVARVVPPRPSAYSAVQKDVWSKDAGFTPSAGCPSNRSTSTASSVGCLGSSQPATYCRLTLPDKRQVLITDTVGFIQKLPPTVVASQSHPREPSEADLLLHIVDIASDTSAQQCHTVEDILKDLGLADKPTLLVLNKIDLLGGEIEPGDDEAVRKYIDQLCARVQKAAFISASKGWAWAAISLYYCE